MRKLIPLLLLVLLTFCSNESGVEKDITISVIPKGTTHVFWQSVHAGAIKASTELGVKINWVGTVKEDDRQLQIALVDNQVMNQVSGILLAPSDDMAMRRPVKSAMEKNVPVVIYDSAINLPEDGYVSFVATDNYKGGYIAGEALAELLDNNGRVILLRYMEGSASTENRERGFLDAISKVPGIKLVSDEQYAGSTTAQAQQASENLLFRFRDRDGNLTIDGIFCPNESSTFGMLQALRRGRYEGDVKFVGFDSSPPLIEGLQNGEIHGLVVQNPFNMGYIGVHTLVDHLKEVEVPKRIDTGVTLVTPESMNDEAIQELINPDLEKWLNMEND